MNKKLSAIDLYLNRAFKFVLILISLAALCSGGTFTFIKKLGYYEDVSWTALLVFDLTTILYTAAAILLILRCEDSNGKIRPEILNYGKIYLAIVAFVQWNYITYMIPSRDFWAYALYFIMLAALFLSSRFVLLATALVIPSMVVSWFVRGEYLLPVRDSIFVPEMILRIVLILLGCACLWILTYFIEKFLVPELETVAEYDPLTSLHNRRTLEDVVGRMINKAFRSGESFTLLMCDLDDFKNINDTYGHDCGDEVLKYVANAVIDNLGDNDTAYRYGGEELLILIDADENTALSRAEAIRHSVEKGNIPHAGDFVSVTVTIGTATYKQYDTLDGMIRTADENMYYGKRNGKNQVVS